MLVNPPPMSLVNMVLGIGFGAATVISILEAWMYVTGRRTLANPTKQIIGLCFWFGFLGFYAWVFYTGQATPLDYIATVAVLCWVVCDLLKFGHADRETLGLSESA